MKVKSKLLHLFLLGSLALTCSVPVLAAPNGGHWSYGGHHDPYNWGAFSNYYHADYSHWSTVVRQRDSRSSYGDAAPKHTSRAFINTHFGEHVWFDCGID